MLARLANGRSHLLQRVIRDSGNFFLGKVLDGIENENLAIISSRMAQGELHQINQLAASRQFFGTASVAVRDDVLFQQLVVGLVKLQS